MFKTGKDNPRYIDGRSIRQHYCLDCNKPICIKAIRCHSCSKKGKLHPLYREKKKNYCIDCGTEILENSTRCYKCANTGKLNPRYGKMPSNAYKKGHISWATGKHFSKEHREKLSKPKTEETKRKLSLKCKERKQWVGVNNPSWQGGVNREGYPFSFNEELKKKIRKRDNCICQFCDKTQLENGKKLDVHHIDYNKKNCSKDNLISLCTSCHMTTNFNGKQWTSYFQEKMLSVAII